MMRQVRLELERVRELSATRRARRLHRKRMAAAVLAMGAGLFWGAVLLMGACIFAAMMSP
jgi:hypothetical protein